MRIHNPEDRSNGNKHGLILVDSQEFAENPLTPLVASATGPIVEKSWRTGPVLNQKQHSCCVGCAVVNFMNADPVEGKLDFDSAFSIYRQAQKIDELPGEEPESYGTTITAGVQVMRNHGWITDCKFTKDASEVQRYISTRGPMIVGTRWYTKMNTPALNGFVQIGGEKDGGHAYLCYGISDKLDAFMCYNSWGAAYGMYGRFFIRFKAMERLLSEGGSIAASPIQRL